MNLFSYCCCSRLFLPQPHPFFFTFCSVFAKGACLTFVEVCFFCILLPPNSSIKPLISYACDHFVVTKHYQNRLLFCHYSSSDNFRTIVSMIAAHPAIARIMINGSVPVGQRNQATYKKAAHQIPVHQ